MSRQTCVGQCERCPLEFSPVAGYGYGDGIAIVGESPGLQEVRQGQPFIGPSGKLVRHVLQTFGANPELAYWTNTVLCHAPSKPIKDAVSACHGRLMHVELPEVNPTKILALGASALYTLTFADCARPPSITRQHGRGFYTHIGKDDREVYCVATYHPAAVLRDPNLFRDFASDIRKFLSHDAPQTDPPLDVQILWRTDQVAPTLEALSHASVVSCDLETMGLNVARHALLSIGFAAKTCDGKIYSVIIPAHLLRDPSVKTAVVSFLES